MKNLRIFLLVVIIVGFGLLATQKLWVPKLVNKILELEAQKNKPISWIGTEYPPIPKNVSMVNGNIIGNQIRSNHRLEEVLTKDGPELWLSRKTDILFSDQAMNQKYAVVDVLDIPFKDTALILVRETCSKGNFSSTKPIVSDDTIMALVNKNEISSKGRAEAVQAWKINLYTEKIESYPKEGIVCVAHSS